MSCNNRLKPDLDIAGSRVQTDSLNKEDEALKLGAPIMLGAGATVTVGATVVVTGLSGFSANSVGKFLTLSGSGLTNNGTFQIIAYNSPTSITIDHATAANESGLDWIERFPYTLETDLNYIRTDRADIKGVAYDDPVPTYTRCDDPSTPIPANLSNIAGRTTDAKSLVDNIKINNISITAGTAFVTITSVGELKHADAADPTGVPVNDGYDAGNDAATFVAILGDGYGRELQVLSGINAGNRIFGRTRAGVSASPNSVEIEFRSVATGDDISNSIAYTWENQQDTDVTFIIGYRNCLNNLVETSLRTLLIAGTLYGGGGSGSLSLPINAINVIVDNTNLVISNGTNVQEVLEDLDGYIAANQFPTPNDVGHFLYSADGIAFRSEQPLVNEQEGWILVNDDSNIVVIG